MVRSCQSEWIRDVISGLKIKPSVVTEPGTLIVDDFLLMDDRLVVMQ